MDPLSLILVALATGAAKAAGDTVPDAYNGLKTLIKRKFAGEPKAEMVLEEHEIDPETYEAPLKKKLAEAGADKDQEIIKSAQKLMEQLNPQAAAAGNFNVQISGGKVQGLTQQNTGTIAQEFN